jgi:hypothetical protein
MLTLGDALSEMELRKDLLVEVEGYRLAKLATGRELGWQVRVMRTAASQGVRRLMVRLGCFLEACGCQLQRWFAIESGSTVG